MPPDHDQHNVAFREGLPNYDSEVGARTDAVDIEKEVLVLADLVDPQVFIWPTGRALAVRSAVADKYPLAHFYILSARCASRSDGPGVLRLSRTCVHLRYLITLCLDSVSDRQRATMPGWHCVALAMSGCVTSRFRGSV
jgi:hypothetical protein